MSISRFLLTCARQNTPKRSCTRLPRPMPSRPKIVRKLDYEMISLHFAYRMNLPSKMFSPLANNRTDQWNGSLKNRMHIRCWCCGKVREAVGPNTILRCSGPLRICREVTPSTTVAFLNRAKEYVDMSSPANDGVPAHPTSLS